MAENIFDQAEFLVSISSIPDLKHFGILLIDEEERSNVCREPSITLPNETVPWIAIKQKKNQNEQNSGIWEAALSKRGLSCVAIGIGAIVTAKTGGLGGVAIASFAGASYAMAAHQCSVYVTQVGQTAMGYSEDVESYNQSGYAQTLDFAYEASQLMAGASALHKSAASLSKTANVGLKLQFETGLALSKSSQSSRAAAQVLKVILSDKTMLLNEVFQVLKALHKTGKHASNIKDLYDINFALTEKKN